MNEDFDNLVFYAMCESLYLQKDKTNYVSFSGMCQNMHDSIMNNLPMSTDLYKVVSNMMRDVMLLYGFDPDEMAEYVSMFIVGEKWEEYKEFVIILKQDTRNSFQ